MEEQLELISAGDLAAYDPKEIDAVIQKMLRESYKNGEDIQQLTLECSAALASADARTTALKEQGCFKRLWNNAIGKNDKLRTAIAQDNMTAQYAMQQTVNGILKECINNRQLALAVKTKLDGEILRLEQYQVKQGQELNHVRQVLVAFYRNYLAQNERIFAEFAHRDGHAGRRCEYCREEINDNEVVCHHCGTVQKLKWERMPMNTQQELQKLSELMRKPLERWNPEITWDLTAKRYADMMSQGRAMAQTVGALSKEDQLSEKIENLIQKCRSAEFQIAVVGVLKAGKSMLMNALIGEELAAVGLNSTTAALTKFRSSSAGNYIRVHFYSENEWKSLTDSAKSNQSKSSIRGSNDEEGRDLSLAELLDRPSTREEAKKWVGHKTIRKKCGSIPELREEIKRWTAADSADHLFASEVEVGIDKKFFDMPEEVVFVDKPGLHDPVKYRSNITKEYIAHANAVLVAVKLGALTEEPLETITTVLDYAGNNRDKVFIVGTQKDVLNEANDYDQLVNGKGGWVDQLTQTRYFEDRDTVSLHILTVSAYLHLCMKKALALDEADLKDSSKFAKSEYRNLKNGIEKILDCLEYPLVELRSDDATIQKITESFGIKRLQKRLEVRLISRYRTLKIENLAADFRIYRDQLVQEVQKENRRRRDVFQTAQEGMDALSKKAAEAKREKENLEAEKRRIEGALEKLREFTRKKIQKLSFEK